MSRRPTAPRPATPKAAPSHYDFRIGLRIQHPDADPERITHALGMAPRGAWKAGAPRQTPSGTPLEGSYAHSYWYADMLAAQHPDMTLDAGLREILDRLSAVRDFLHLVRAEGGATELFVGWFFARQSGDVLTHTTLRAAADLKIDISLDVYPHQR